MTAEEILALPELVITYRTIVAAGRTLRVPVMPALAVRFQPVDEPLYATDAEGVDWIIAKTQDGQLLRRRT